jgi:hypothetical protein
MSYATAIREHAATLGFIGSNPAHVEAWMRIEHGTLDALSPTEFRREVAIAIACANASSTDENDALAASFGIRAG